MRRLQADGCSNLVTRTHRELDLTNQASVNSFFAEQQPQIVFLAAAKVGGILANNTQPGAFIRENLFIECNVIDAARRNGVERLIYLGSSCIYPKLAPQPIREEYLLSGPLEPTNEAYAVAKIAGLKMCQAFALESSFDWIGVMPSNLYGPGDNFDLQTSHVLPALLRKIHEARISRQPWVEIWGSGNPRREFLFVDDLADACVFLAQQESQVLDQVAPDRIFNIGIGSDVTIAELASTIQSVVQYDCDLVFDDTKPDGVPQKLLDVSRLKTLGWIARTPLAEGIAETYRWFLNSSAMADLAAAS